MRVAAIGILILCFMDMGVPWLAGLIGVMGCLSYVQIPSKKNQGQQQPPIIYMPQNQNRR